MYTEGEEKHRRRRREMMTNAGEFVWSGLVVME